MASPQPSAHDFRVAYSTRIYGRTGPDPERLLTLFLGVLRDFLRAEPAVRELPEVRQLKARLEDKASAEGVEESLLRGFCDRILRILGVERYASRRRFLQLGFVVLFSQAVFLGKRRTPALALQDLLWHGFRYRHPNVAYLDFTLLDPALDFVLENTLSPAQVWKVLDAVTWLSALRKQDRLLHLESRPTRVARMCLEQRLLTEEDTARFFSAVRGVPELGEVGWWGLRLLACWGSVPKVARRPITTEYLKLCDELSRRFAGCPLPDLWLEHETLELFSHGGAQPRTEDFLVSSLRDDAVGETHKRVITAETARYYDLDPFASPADYWNYCLPQLVDGRSDHQPLGPAPLAIRLLWLGERCRKENPRAPKIVTLDQLFGRHEGTFRTAIAQTLGPSRASYWIDRYARGATT
jgi:hypothetical protein